VLTHDVESSKGVENTIKVMDLESKLGFRSSFNFVARDYPVPRAIREAIVRRGFEVGLHGIHHNPAMYLSESRFRKYTRQINQYLSEWNVVGFRSPAMYRNLSWLSACNIHYDASTFDTDPFEPQATGASTIFPFIVNARGDSEGYVELPYTLPQDFTLFVILKEQSIDIWKRKLDWLAENGGMALLITHPDYMHFPGSKKSQEQYPCELYSDFLTYIQDKYRDSYALFLPRELADFWRRQNHKGDPSA
jgi:peptidoglycan/xylan/chitin deacetylase (PgdA/CDA1 family)